MYYYRNSVLLARTLTLTAHSSYTLYRSYIKYFRRLNRKPQETEPYVRSDIYFLDEIHALISMGGGGTPIFTTAFLVTRESCSLPQQKRNLFPVC